MSRHLFYAAALAGALSACGPVNRDLSPASRGLEPINQPVVSRTDYVLDLSGGYDGLAEGEASRLDAWLRSLDVGYGDTVYVDGPAPGGTGRTAVEAVVSQFGLTVSPGAPVTNSRVREDATRVIVSRTEAYVPGCPLWEREGSIDYNNEQGAGYGCAVNGSLAAMIADPEDLLQGRDAGAVTDARVINRTVKAYRNQAGGK